MSTKADTMKNNSKWYEDDDTEEGIEYVFKEYDVTSMPNDFNTKTIIDFIESGLFKIPGFQRNYVWDIKRASKLIESLIIGLPIPQVFLYEEGKNSYLVIDGQQRLLTIYFFKQMRFPKEGKRFELRQIFEKNNHYPAEILHNDEYFDDFKLNLPDNKQLHKLNYSTLGDLRNNFDMRTIRNIMIKQNLPTNDDSAMYEVFNRLNSGGVTLQPQEIRASLYHSKFYESLYDLNNYDNWRTILHQSEADTHMKDIEIMLRGFAMLLNSKDYTPSMTKFLNKFSKETKGYTDEALEYFEKLFKKFCDNINATFPNSFISSSGRFSITLFESIFVALCVDAVKGPKLSIKKTTAKNIEKLKSDKSFVEASQKQTTSKQNLNTRLQRAKELL